MRRSSAWAWALAAAAVALLAFALALSLLAGSHGSPWWEVVLGVVAVLSSAAIGLLVVVRRGGHRVGWLLLANALIPATWFFTESYAQYAVLEAPGALPGAEWAVLWAEGAWPLLFAPLTAIAFVFPDGRLPSPRWRPVAIGVAATFVGLLLVSFFEPGAFEAPYQQVEDPLAAAPSAIAWLWPPLLIGAVASLVAAVRAVRVRFLAASGLERLQLKWLAYSAFLVPATLLVCLAGALVVEGLEQRMPS